MTFRGTEKTKRLGVFTEDCIEFYPPTTRSLGKRNPINKPLNTCLNTNPESEPALELHSQAVASVEACHHVNGPDTGKNSGGRRQQNTIVIRQAKIQIICEK